MKFNFALLVLCFSLNTNLFAQGPTLVADLNQGDGDGFSSFNYKGINLGDQILLPASDGNTGEELYVLNSEGISLLKDINEGAADSDPKGFTFYNDKVYFIAGNAENGREIWSTDGTKDGTTLAIEVVEGTGSTNPSKLWVSRANQLFFTSNERLYVSDGTTEGTSRVMNIDGVSVSGDSQFASSRASLFRDGIAFFEEFGSQFRIWGYQADTLKKLYELQGFFTDIYGLHEVEKGLVFTRDACCGSEADLNGLYLYNQALDSTYRLVDQDGVAYDPDRVWSFVENKFAFLDRGNGYFVSDGTTEGTIKTSDNTPFSITQGESIQNITVGGKMIHWEEKDGFDETLVITDGTVEGSKELVKLDEVFTSGFVATDQYVFWTNGISNGFPPSIWVANMETEEAEKLHTFTEDPTAINSVLPLGVINNQLYLVADLVDEVGRELYRFTLDFISSSTSLQAPTSTVYQLLHASGARSVEIKNQGRLETIHVQLFDGNGRRVYESVEETGNRFEVKIAQTGIYILQVNGVEGVQSFKVFMR